MANPTELSQDHVPEALLETPKVPLRTLLRQNPYVLGLACVGVFSMSPLDPLLIVVVVRISRRFLVWLRPGSCFWSYHHGVIWRSIPQNLLG